jgi:3-mercaptopyruvate sulfurtransferase SseA
MRLFALLAGVMLLAAVLIAGCSSNSNKPPGTAGPAVTGPTPPLSPPNTPPDNVRRVTITELRDAMDRGKAVLIDVRGDDAYKREHIKGALDIPEGQLVARASEFPKDKLIVLYCS